MLGITLALELASRGHKVSLIEAADTPGGLVTPCQLGDVTWDRFYHVVVSSDSRLLALLEKIGLSEQVHWGQTNTLFYAGQDLYPLNNVFDYLKLPVLSLIDKVRLGFNIVYGASKADGHKLESQSAEQWLTRISGRNAYRKLWRPLLRAKLGSNEPKASAAFIWSVMRRFYGAREGKSKVELYGYVRGGYAAVIKACEAYLRSQGVELICNARVEQVESGETGVRVSWGGETCQFDKAAVTFASPIAQRIFHQFSEQETRQMSGILYQGVVCVSLLLRRPLGGAYLTYITDETLPFTTVIEMSSLVDRDQLDGHHLVYLPKYVPSDDAFLRLDDERIVADFLAGLKRIYPDLDDQDVLSVHVARTPYVAPVMTLNYSENIPPVNLQAPHMYMISSAQLLHGSSSVEETMRLVDRSLPQMLGNDL